MVTSDTKHLAGPSLTLLGPLQLEPPRIFHLPLVWTRQEVGENGTLELVLISFWPGGALQFKERNRQGVGMGY